jgi:Methyltransferase domain
LLPASVKRAERMLDDSAVVLDIGGWAKPLARADWVLDLMPYETRGLYGAAGTGPERFTKETWVERDICDREPFPFADGQFDFCVCSHTLEDIRDPIWVCGEINRIAKAGYIEVPSRLEEQSFGVHGPWVGWSHHRWLVDVGAGEIEFVAKPGMLQGREEFHFDGAFGKALTPEERVQPLFWKDSFEFAERIFFEPSELDAYLAEFVSANLGRHSRPRRRGSRERIARLLGR